MLILVIFSRKNAKKSYTQNYISTIGYISRLQIINCFYSSRSCCCSLLVTEVPLLLRFHPAMVIYTGQMQSTYCVLLQYDIFFPMFQQVSCLFSSDSRLIRRYGFLYSFLQSCKSLSIRCDSYKIHSCNQQSRNSAFSNIQRQTFSCSKRI